MRANVTREQFLKNQSEVCAKNNWPHFMPYDGICHGPMCAGPIHDMVDEEIESGNDGTKHVDYCKVCHASFCD
jgi:hypothetical protein